MAEAQVAMDKADMKRVLAAANTAPVNCALAEPKEGSLALLLLHKLKQPKALEKELQGQFPASKNLRFGTAIVDPEADPKLVKFIINKTVSGMGRRLVKTLKGTGFTKVEIGLEDGTSVETHGEEDEAEAAAAPTAAAATPAAAAPAAPGPDAGALQHDIASLIGQVKALQDPAQKMVLAKLAAAANDRLKAGDLAGAAEAAGQLRQGLGAAVPAAASSAAAPAQPPAADAAKMHNTLMQMMLKIPDFAEGAAQHEDWLARANRAEQIVEGDPAQASALIVALGREMAEAAKRKQAADGPKTEWKKVYADCLKQADELKAAILAAMSDAGMHTARETFLANWAALENGLDDIGETIGTALRKTKTLPRTEAAAVIQKAVATATKQLDASGHLANVDDNSVLPVTIAASLRSGLAKLGKATEATAS